MLTSLKNDSLNDESIIKKFSKNKYKRAGMGVNLPWSNDRGVQAKSIQESNMKFFEESFVTV